MDLYKDFSVMISEKECIECGLCCWFDPNTIIGEKERIIKPSGFCIYKEENGCKIYDKRPQACRDYERGGELCLERRKLKDILYVVLIGFSIVAFWRGVWGLMDLYLFPNNILLSYVVSILFSITILYSTKSLLTKLH